MNQALLVIDAQEIYTNPDLALYCPDADATLRNINSLIAAFQQRNETIIYIKHSHNPDKSDLGHMFDFAGPTDTVDFLDGTADVAFSENLLRCEHATVITKKRYSSFYNTNLQETLQALSIERVVICGFMTNFCCESAARDAHDRDFLVDFIVDATGTPGVDGMNQDDIRQSIGKLLQAGFATVKTTSQFLLP